MNFILDTNAVIYLQKGLLDQPLPPGNMAISVISEIELRGFPGLTADQETWLLRFLNNIQIIDLRSDIKNEAIRLRRHYRIKIPDAIIAATAIMQSAILLTNDEHLHGVSGLSCRKLALIKLSVLRGFLWKSALYVT